VDPDSKRLRVSVTDGTGAAVRDGGLARWLAALAPPRAVGAVNIALVSDARMRALNLKYRGQDKTTDVLSFAAEPPPSSAGSTVAGVAGDIVIATGVARRQAKEAGHSYQAEWRVLALHGLLHLLGYDHHHRDDDGRMARVERRLRRKGRLETGLIERAASAPRRRRVSA
jgi:probable rRNA maturation factor